jgi:hypothetical protein
MYDTEISQAMTVALTDLRDNGQSNGTLANATEARPYMKAALESIVGELSGELGRLGLSGMMGAFVASGMLKRAAYDLYGSCRLAAMLYARGEWSVVSAIRKSPTWLGAASSIGRTLFSKAVWKLPDTVADRVDAYIKLIQQSYVDFGVEVATRLRADNALIGNLFGAAGGVTALDVMGSDPHHCARRVVIVTYGNGTRVVYKPTDLTFQLMLMGSPQSFVACALGYPLVANCRSLFDLLNMDLPVVHIAAPRRNAGYGYMEFKPKAANMTDQQADRFYYKMGRLIAVAAAFGITDLHKENVMATTAGPYLIDAEMGFSVAPQGSAPLFIVNHTKLEDALLARPPQYSQMGGTFAPYLDPAGWEANSISMPYDGNEVNSSVPRAMGPGFRTAKPHALLILAGIQDGVDGVVAARDSAWNWLIQQFDRVNPLARVLLNTQTMVIQHVAGVTAYLRGTLTDEGTAINGPFMSWMEWYGGMFNAVPAAFYPPRNRLVMYDPRPSIGVTAAAAAQAGIQTSTTADVRAHLGLTLMGSAIATTKAALKAGLEQSLQIPALPSTTAARRLVV